MDWWEIRKWTGNGHDNGCNFCMESHHVATEAIKENSLNELKAIPQIAYEKCMEDWVKRWRCCIASDGAYFEGDKIYLDE